MGDTILRVDDIQKFYGNKGNLTKSAGGIRKEYCFLQERHGFGHAVSCFNSSSTGTKPTRS